MEYNGEAITKVRARELYNEADQKVLNTAFINTEIKNAEKHIQSERSERIQRIIADVKSANKTDGTQADSNP